MKSLRREKRGPEKIRATREQARRFARKAEAEGLEARRRFRASSMIFVGGLLLIGIVCLTTIRKVESGNAANTLLFIIAATGLCITATMLLSRDLERRFFGMKETIRDKGLSGKLKE